MTVSLIYVLVKLNAEGRRHAQLRYFMPANSERAEGGNRIKLSKDAQRMRVMQMQQRLVSQSNCLSVCLSVCVCVFVSALPGMPHLAFNQKQTANKQPPTGNGSGAKRERENEASAGGAVNIPCPTHVGHMGHGQRPLFLLFLAC